MKKLLILLLTIFFIGCNTTTTNSSKKIIVPQYFYDYNLWDKVAKADIKGYVIVNPADGPGDNVDSAYVNDIEKLINYGKTPIGYVYTKWGDRDISEVKKDIDKWLELYPKIKGFFIDEASSLSNKFPYYNELKNYISSKGNFKFVLNPGTFPDEVYFSIADAIVVFESVASKVPNDICTSYSDKSAIIVYGASEEKMRELVRKPCTYFYITDDNDSRPYDTLPSYFDEEIELLKGY